MPDHYKKKKRVEARKAAYEKRQREKARKTGERYVKASGKQLEQAVKHAAKSVSTKSHTKKTMHSEKAAAHKTSSERLKAAGQEAIETGQRPAKKRHLKATPQSQHEIVTSQDPYYSGRKRLRREVRGR